MESRGAPTAFLMSKSSCRFTDDRGFTLVEVLVAMTILIAGVLGVVALVDGANAETNAADTRIGATNLAREITEAAHAVDYDSLLTSTGGLGPRIASMSHLTELAQPLNSAGCSTGADCYQTTSSSLPFSAITAPAAASLHWSASDGTSSGTLSPAQSTTSFLWSWDVTS